MAVDRRPRAPLSTAASDPEVRLLRQRFVDEFLKCRPVLLDELKLLLPLFDEVRPDLRFCDDSERPVWGWARVAFPNAIPCAGSDRCPHCRVREMQTCLHARLAEHGLDVPWLLDTALNTLEIWRDLGSQSVEPQGDVETIARGLQSLLDELGLEFDWTSEDVSHVIACFCPAVRPEQAGLILPPTDVRDLGETTPVLETRFQPEPGESSAEYRSRIQHEFSTALSQHLDAVNQSTYALPLPQDSERGVRWLAQLKAGDAPLSIAEEEDVSVKTIERRAAAIAKIIAIPLKIKRGRPRRKK